MESTKAKQIEAFFNHLNSSMLRKSSDENQKRVWISFSVGKKVDLPR